MRKPAPHRCYQVRNVCAYTGKWHFIVPTRYMIPAVYIVLCADISPGHRVLGAHPVDIS